jgi:hypothetical protein
MSSASVNWSDRMNNLQLLALAALIAWPTHVSGQSGANQLAELMLRMEQLDIQRAQLNAQRAQVDGARMESFERAAAQRRLFDQRWILQIQKLAQPRVVFGTMAQRLVPRLIATGNDLFLVEPTASDDRMRGAAEPHFLWLDDEKKRFLNRVVLPLKPAIDSLGLTADMNQSFFAALSPMVHQGFMNMPDQTAADFRGGVASLLVATKSRVDSIAREAAAAKARADSIDRRRLERGGVSASPRPSTTKRPRPRPPV